MTQTFIEKHRYKLALVGPLALLLLWWAASSAQWVSPKLLPDPLSTFKTLAVSAMDATMWTDIKGTTVRTLGAFVIAALIGIPAGIVLGANQIVYRSVEFLVDFFRSTPATAMFPLFLLIFGIGETSKIAVAAFAAWLVILFNVAYGVMNARQTRILAARVMGASDAQIFRQVLFFESLPQTFVGLRIGVSMALVVIIVAEMFIGSSNGMGRRIIDAQQVFDLKQMYASIIVTGVLGYSFNLLCIGIERYFVRWSGK